MGHLQRELLVLSDFTFERTRARLEGLTDDEWLWEPAPWCWSVRRVGDEWVGDGTVFPGAVPAFTTIAWRLDHLIWCYGAPRNASWVGSTLRSPLGPLTGTAREELARLDVAHAFWREVVSSIDEDALAVAIGPIGQQYAAESRLAFVLHMLDEVIHHGAEIGVLRDLHRSASMAPPALDTVADAAANGRWDVVVDLCEAGATWDAVDGFTPLHRAVAAGQAQAVRALLARGADTAARDPQYGETPAGWARYFGREELVPLL
jgi:hypothetical protein